MSWMDVRAYQPYEVDDSAVAYVTTSSGYITHRFTGRFRDTAANNIVDQWPIDTDTWQWSDDPAVLERWNIPREMLFELQMPGDIAGYVTPEAAAAYKAIELTISAPRTTGAERLNDTSP